MFLFIRYAVINNKEGISRMVDWLQCNMLMMKLYCKEQLGVLVAFTFTLSVHI